MNADEATVTAPRADAFLHVLDLHVHRYGNSPGPTSARIATMTVLALMESYEPEEIPEGFVAAFEQALNLAATSARLRSQRETIRHNVVASPGRRADINHLTDLAQRADEETRRLIRHKITLEGPDL